MLGVVGRDTGRLRLAAVAGSGRVHLEPRVLARCPPGVTVYTDQWHAYAKLPGRGRPHGTVCHDPRRPGGPEFARDDDGDGVREIRCNTEVHCNTLEGIWTGLRNFPRPFRGVSKWRLSAYVAVFEWTHNLKAATTDFLRAMLVPPRHNTVGT